MKELNLKEGLFAFLLLTTSAAQGQEDTTRIARNLTTDEVVVTGTRNETDIRHLPMTISVVGRKQLESNYQPSVLPTLTEQVPGFFTTSRGIMGYGVSTGAAGGMSLRGIGGSPTAGLLVLIEWRYCADRLRYSTARMPWAVSSTSSHGRWKKKVRKQTCK